ncbi:MAG: GNAT family N-acetyltransferase [Salegentibacter sp.]|uniref:Acetyltransferase (GNAT) domain-containing protein n=1 Tax=Salegentibacter flavus TaxID=287099 RepID=A0A1I5BB06_9FLAO|nr:MULTISPECIES: GNAT family N-acetyltransferase [Salegentibacter]MDR9457288.1 GNAT family N-acetyltransferase [Salegentibacter sp.]SFN71894.1 Acetyltransferase (GNAT) domain-containing protein [Salegentibacter flavus]
MEIISYQSQYAKDFKELNIAWLEKYFWVEPHDEEVLGNPEKYIIEPGGTIFFVKEADEIIGCVALMKMDEGVFELTKMAITPTYQGKKIGQKLMEHSIRFAKEQGWDYLIIFSNRKLENAIYIYKKYGFEEIPIGANNPYTRGDIKMRLNLS